MPGELPILWINGWGADERSLQPQLDRFADRSIYADWLPWRVGESLSVYAHRLAHRYDPGGPCILAGFSMGGMITRELTALLDVRRVFLLSSIRGPRELPDWLTGLSTPGHALPFCVWYAGHRALCRGSRICHQMGWVDGHRLDQMDDSPTQRLMAAGRAMMAWQNPPAWPTDLPVHHIHGRLDRILPARYTQPDHTIPDAGHVITLTHPRTVNDYIASHL